MKTRRPRLSLLLIPVTLAGWITWPGEFNVSQAARSEDPKDLQEYSQSIRKAEDALARLGQGSVLEPDNAKRAIARGFDVLRQLLKGDSKRAEELGFQIGQDTKSYNFTAADIAKNATLLDNAFPVFEIRLRDLHNFPREKDVAKLLFFTNQILLPISADKQKVQSSLTIRFTIDIRDATGQKQPIPTWRPTRWGQKKLITLLTTSQEENGQQANRKPGFLVAVPALNLYFLGYKDNTTIKFVPLATNRHFNEGESLFAEQAFERLAEEAMNLDDRPR